MVSNGPPVSAALGDRDRHGGGGFATDTPEDRMFDYANECHRRKDYRAAATSFRQTLALNPNHAGALGNLSITMLMLGRPDIALRHADAGVRVAPGSHPLRMRLGLALHACGRFEDAVARLREARAMQPDHADTVTAGQRAWRDRRTARSDRNIARSRRVCVRTTRGYHTNLAYTLLRAGQWEEGWREHEYRPERPRDRPDLERRGAAWHAVGVASRTRAPATSSSSAVSRRSRHDAPVARRSCIAPRTLRDLLRGLPGVTILTADDPPPAGAMQFPLLSLPLLFHTTPASIPARGPYLQADPAFGRDGGNEFSRCPASGWPRMGGQSAVGHGVFRIHRSPAVVAGRRRCSPLAGTPGVTFVSLQVGDAPPPGVAIVDWTSGVADFSRRRR